MAYTYYNSRFVNGDMRNPRTTYIDDFEKILADEFENSPTYFQIEEEYPIGSMTTFRTIDARVVHAVTNKLGANLGDDWKTIMFPDPQYNAKLGTLYRFDSNIWLSYTTERIKGIATSIVVRRCNNVLRWIDSNGAIHEVPCVIDYPIRENRDYATAGSAIVTPAGMIEIFAPYNTVSNEIRPNQRFLFGNPSNWTAYKVMGGGVNNFTNQQTLDNTSVGILRLTMGSNYVNVDTDDLVNGIADAYDVIYTIAIQQAAVSVQVGTTLQLNATVYRNSQIVDDASVTWSTSSATKATVSSSGLVTGVASGSCVITATLEDNEDVKDTVAVTVQTGVATVYEVVVSPDDSNQILEGETQSFDVRLYKNGVVQSDAFTFSVAPSCTVPTSYYVFSSIDTHTFVVYNGQRYMDSPLIIRCVSTFATLDFNIILAGAW